MSIGSALGFTLAMLVLAASPGPGVMGTVARALSSGFRPALFLIGGIVAGDILYLLFAVIGLSMLARAMGSLFAIVKIGGGAYLVWLGIRLWVKKPAPASPYAGGENGSRAGNFASGLLITLSNPKVIVFYCGFLPTFMDLSTVTPVAFVTIAVIVSAVLSGVLGTYALLASRARMWFTTVPAMRRLNRTAGVVMATAGVVIATRS